jgi:hypothetical protein
MTQGLGTSALTPAILIVRSSVFIKRGAIKMDERGNGIKEINKTGKSNGGKMTVV